MESGSITYIPQGNVSKVLFISTVEIQLLLFAKRVRKTNSAAQVAKVLLQRTVQSFILFRTANNNRNLKSFLLIILTNPGLLN